MNYSRKAYLAAAIFAVALSGSLTSCQNEDETLARAVLASAESLTFKGEDAAPQMITVYSDAQWVAEVPEWVTIEPQTGSGTTEVTVSVSDNIRDNALDNPRSGNLVFKGSTLDSRDIVVVNQEGDKYRDVPESTITDVVGFEDGTVVIVPDAQVVALTVKGAVVSDGTSNLYVVTDPSVLAVGDKVSFSGDKTSESKLPAVNQCDEFAKTGTGAVEYGTPKDITEGFDDYASESREYVTFSGVLSSNIVSVTGASTFSAAIVDAPESLDLEKNNGWIVEVKGYYAGTAAPFINIMATEVTGVKLAETVYYSEDFEWLEPWALAGDNKGKPAGQTVETDDLQAYCPQLPTPKVEGVSALEALENEGYEMLRVWADGKKEEECIYLQSNYLKFGKTGYQAGIVLPPITGIPDGEELFISFDWCPMKQGVSNDYKIDPVNLIVVVTNGDEEQTFEVETHDWENGHKLGWINTSVELKGVKVTEETRIAIKQTQWGVTTANRWFLDNIKIFSLIK